MRQAEAPLHQRAQENDATLVKISRMAPSGSISETLSWLAPPRLSSSLSASIVSVGAIKRREGEGAVAAGFDDAEP